MDLLGILGRLVTAQVDFVLIGGLAATVHGSPTVTGDVDICHDRRPDNLGRLAATLERLGARLRGAEDSPWRPTPEALALSDILALTTDLGPLDLLAAPAPFRGYDELCQFAIEIDLGLDSAVRVVGLEALIAMKESTDRPKDRIEVVILDALRNETSDYQHGD